VCEDEIHLEVEADRKYDIDEVDLMTIWDNDGRILCADCALEYVSKMRDQIDSEKDDLY
jgi:hypothetical protein